MARHGEVGSFMENLGYEVCRNWLGGYRWQEILPREGSLQPGEEAVKAFAPQLAWPAKHAFVKGWNRYLAECGLSAPSPFFSAEPVRLKT